MILETKQEKDAFEFVCGLASLFTDRTICNDLDASEENKFKHIRCERRTADGKLDAVTPAQYDSDVLCWLEEQVKYSDGLKEAKLVEDI